MSMVAPHQKPDEASPHQESSIRHTLFLAVTWIIKGLLRAGIPMGPMALLTVRGRKSGEPRTTPVDLFERAGRSFLVSTHRQESSNWVRNLRAAGEGALTRGRSRRAITVVELPPDVAGQVLKEVLGPRLASPVGGFILRRTFPVPPDAPLEDFISAARSHPVFELISPGTSGSPPMQSTP
jgi:deazaflavin-dependent oxidoreductase (nitroreductase family)